MNRARKHFKSRQLSRLYFLVTPSTQLLINASNEAQKGVIKAVKWNHCLTALNEKH